MSVQDVCNTCITIFELSPVLYCLFARNIIKIYATKDEYIYYEESDFVTPCCTDHIYQSVRVTDTQ